MKNFIYLLSAGIALGTLGSCASISNAVDDDVYVTKGVEIPIDESLNDETSYTAYKYKKERENSSTQYVTNNYYGDSYGNNYGNGGYGAGYTPYGYSPYGYQPYYGYSSHHRPWRYVPGYGWSYVGYPYSSGFGFSFGFSYGMGYGYSPYGYGGYGHGYGYNPYGYGYGYNPYGYDPYGYNPYGYHNPYYYGNSGGHNYGNSNNNNNGLGGSWGNASNSSNNHFRGQRGSSGGGVVTRNNAPGVLKIGDYDNSTKNPLSRNTVSNNVSGKEANLDVRPVAKENISNRNVTPNSNSTIRETKTVAPGSVSPVRDGVRENVRPIEQNTSTPVRTPNNENRNTVPNSTIRESQRGTSRVVTPISPSRSNPTIQREASPARNSGGGTIRQENPNRSPMQSQPQQRSTPSMNQQQSRPTPSASPSNRGSGSNSGATSRPSSSGSTRPSGGR